jgi:hypothetical protein
MIKNALTKAFNVSALVVGGTGALISGTALMSGGASTANMPGGVDLTLPTAIIGVASVALMWAGYRGFHRAVQRSNNDAPPPPR